MFLRIIFIDVASVLNCKNKFRATVDGTKKKSPDVKKVLYNGLQSVCSRYLMNPDIPGVRFRSPVPFIPQQSVPAHSFACPRVLVAGTKRVLTGLIGDRLRNHQGRQMK